MANLYQDSFPPPGGGTNNFRVGIEVSESEEILKVELKFSWAPDGQQSKRVTIFIPVHDAQKTQRIRQHLQSHWWGIRNKLSECRDVIDGYLSRKQVSDVAPTCRRKIWNLLIEHLADTYENMPGLCGKSWGTLYQQGVPPEVERMVFGGDEIDCAMQHAHHVLLSTARGRQLIPRDGIERKMETIRNKISAMEEILSSNEDLTFRIHARTFCAEARRAMQETHRLWWAMRAHTPGAGYTFPQTDFVEGVKESYQSMQETHALCRGEAAHHYTITEGKREMPRIPTTIVLQKDILQIVGKIVDLIGKPQDFAHVIQGRQPSSAGHARGA